jgi:very-short-patch-repair endonuclease
VEGANPRHGMRRTLITNRARALRKEMSGAEVILWTRLRGRGPDRPSFRRQHPLGNIILDFYCPSAQLDVEVDGRTHWDQAAQANDAARDFWLSTQGIEVMRIPASSLYNDLSDTVDAIIRRAEERRAELQRTSLAPSTTRSSAGGPPPAASRGR